MYLPINFPPGVPVVMRDGRLDGPLPHEYTIIECTRDVCAPFVEEIHYAQRWPSVSFRFALMRGFETRGIITFGKPATAQFRNSYFGKPNAPYVFELNRLALLPDQEPNEASRLIGAALKMLYARRGPTLVVSLADTSQGHLGTVYQATNFTYVGLTASRPDYRIIDPATGKPMALHNQTLSDLARGKELPGEKRRATLDRLFGAENVSLVDRPRKHRYVTALGPHKFRHAALNEWLRYEQKPYPKRGAA
ncbi:Mom family adenine methylcarbamoylation protein [Falsiruegeria mediterranea]|uniref:Mom family adenine methylcarbamoylation protein n=1 Tax=Falsiruegeria mediterranea TaxID=1280832 RepID=UPI0015F286BF|nr:hypothetical protein [Falsiruegeria mediterranea]